MRITLKERVSLFLQKSGNLGILEITLTKTESCANCQFTFKFLNLSAYQYKNGISVLQ